MKENLDTIKYLINACDNPEAGIYTIYSPVILNKKIIFESKRKYKDQFIRLNYFPDFNGESVLDVGCNTGFILQQLKNTGLRVGVDYSVYNTEIARIVNAIEGGESEFFPLNIMGDTIPGYENYVFDNSLLLSVSSPIDEDNNVTYQIGFDKMMDIIKLKTSKSMYIEPTNHAELPVEEMKEYYKEYFKKWGTPVFLGVTDYQNRLMYRIDL